MNFYPFTNILPADVILGTHETSPCFRYLNILIVKLETNYF